LPGAERKYAWTAASVTRDFNRFNPDVPLDDFVTVPTATEPDKGVPEHRPYLIVGGTAIYMHDAYTYPRLMPVEYTPLYTGVRHRFSAGLGGIYVWPFAYNAAAAEVADERLVRVRVDVDGPPFRLADVIASSGAAPLLSIFLKDPTGKGSSAFPTLNHFTIRDGQPSAVTARILHGDGGFTDNLGIMPLLARQVQNIILFVNDTGPLGNDRTVQSLFLPLEERSGSADRSGNVVFKTELFDVLTKGMADNLKNDGAAVFCGDGWDVQPNALYEIRPYTVNVCFVHMEAHDRWFTALPGETKARMAKKDFRNFPWFATFGQNVPYVIRLKPAQVNLLGQLASWMVTGPGKAVIERSEVGRALR
jgi:hypothetical protein